MHCNKQTAITALIWYDDYSKKKVGNVGVRALCKCNDYAGKYDISLCEKTTYWKSCVSKLHWASEYMTFGLLHTPWHAAGHTANRAFHCSLGNKGSLIVCCSSYHSIGGA